MHVNEEYVHNTGLPTQAEIDTLSKATNFMTVSRTVDIHRPVINAIWRWFYGLCLIEETSAFSVTR
jgi:hypothetical protein